MAIRHCSSSALPINGFYERLDKVSAIHVVKIEEVKSEKWSIAACPYLQGVSGCVSAKLQGIYARSKLQEPYDKTC